MSTSCGNFQCTFYILLPFYIREVKIEITLLRIEFLTGIDNSRG